LGTISSSALPGRQSNRTTMGSVELVSYKFFLSLKNVHMFILALHLSLQNTPSMPVM
jgi:hypothetical protein